MGRQNQTKGSQTGEHISDDRWWWVTTKPWQLHFHLMTLFHRKSYIIILCMNVHSKYRHIRLRGYVPPIFAVFTWYTFKGSWRDRLLHCGLTFNSWCWGMSTWSSGVFLNFAWHQVGLDFRSPKNKGWLQHRLGWRQTPGPNMPIWVCLRRANFQRQNVFEKMESTEGWPMPFSSKKTWGF